MRRTVKIMVPAVAVAALLLGLATPASADVAPRRERKTRTVEAQHAPEMAPPLEQPTQPETAPASQPATPEAAPPQSPSKPEPPEAEAKSATDQKSGSCSIDDGSEQEFAGLAALVLLLCGASLLRGRV